MLLSQGRQGLHQPRAEQVAKHLNPGRRGSHSLRQPGVENVEGVLTLVLAAVPRHHGGEQRLHVFLLRRG